MEKRQMEFEAVTVAKTDALDKLSKSVDTLSDKFNEFNLNIEKSSDKTEKCAKKSILATARLKANILGTIDMVNKLTSYVDDLISSQNILNHTFGSGAEELEDYINHLADMTGISTADITKKSALFGEMATSLGMATDIAKDFVIQLDDMSARLSILYGKDFNAFAKAMLDAVKGQTSTLSTMTGVVLKAQTLQATLDSLGISLDASELNGASRAMLQYITIARQLTYSNEDMAKSANSVTYQKALLKNQVKQLGLSIGNILYPALNAILPVLNAILIVINTIIGVLARLMGISNRVANTVSEVTGGFGDLGNSVESASNKVKKSLRSFDKLNNITTPTPTTGTGAGGGLGVDPAIQSAFEKMQNNLLNIKTRAHEIAEEILAWLGFIEDVNGELHFEGATLLRNIYNWWRSLSLLGKIIVGLGLVAVLSKVYGIVVKLATPLARIFGLGWNKVTSFWTALTTGKLTFLEKIGLYVVAIIDIVQGFINMKDAIDNIVETGGDLEDWGRVILGLTEILSGLALVIGLMTGNVNMLVAGIVGTGISAFAEFGLKLGDLNSSADAGAKIIAEYNKNIEKLTDNAKKSTDAIFAKTGRATELATQISKLYDENGKLIGSEETLSTKVKALNDLLGTNYTVTKDGTIEVNGRKVAVQNLIKEVQKYCAQLRIQAELEAYYDVYVERAKKKIELEQQIKEKTDDITTAIDNSKISTKEEFDEFVKVNAKKIKELDDLQYELEDNTRKMENYEKASYEASVGNYDTAHKYLTDTSETIKGSFNTTYSEIINGSKTMTKDLKEELKKVDNMSITLGVVMNADLSPLERKLNNFIDNWNRKHPELSGYGLGGGGGYAKGFANGGFVDSGEVFIARENGLPEMVGRFGNRTAVANNDQIVKGIEMGVARGMSKVNSGGKVVIEANGDASGLLDFITFKQKERDRQYGM